MTDFAVGTILARNYLGFARVLAESLHKYHPAVQLYVLIPDHSPDEPELDSPAIRVLGLEDLTIDDLQSRLRQYNRKEVLVSLKPVLLEYLLLQGHASGLFLDPDMLILGDLTDAFTDVSNHALTLTPHLRTSRKRDGEERTEREKYILKAGLYNGGFVGVSDRPETRRFLNWWSERLRTHCLEDLAKGLHYDQRWLDLAPGFVEDFHLIRDPGINVAYWNLRDHKVERFNDVLMLDGRPCRLFHFSGFQPDKPGQITRYQPDLMLKDIGPSSFLFEEYQRRLKAAGFESVTQAPWPWDVADSFWSRWVIQPFRARLARTRKSR